MMNRLVEIESIVLLLFLLPQFGMAQKEFAKSEHWEKIADHFEVPTQYKGQMGDYRSPLLFDDGTKVETVSDWEQRRKEILSDWQKMLGPWPDLLTEGQLAIGDSLEQDGYTQYTVTLQWTPNEMTHGYLLIPEGASNSAAVITVFYEPETAIGQGSSPYRDFAIQLAKRGLVTLSLGATKATKAKTYGLYYPSIEDAAVQPLSMLGYAAANAWHALSKRPEVDSTRIGIVGHSFGGKWAMFASCLFEKFACAAWSDPGIVFQDDRESINYWEPWYLGYHPKPWRERGLITNDNPAYGLYPKLREDRRDLHELHALMAPRPFLVSGGSEDPEERWIPLNHSLEVNALLGHDDRVGMTNRPDHSPNFASNEVIYHFFAHFLGPK